MSIHPISRYTRRAIQRLYLIWYNSEIRFNIYDFKLHAIGRQNKPKPSRFTIILKNYPQI